MKISNFYLNALLTSLVAFLTSILVLLYVMQPNNTSSNRYSLTTEGADQDYPEIQDIEAKITALEDFIVREKTRADDQEKALKLQTVQLKSQLAKITKQLEQSNIAAQSARQRLSQESGLVTRLSQQLNNEKIRTLEQEMALASNNQDIQALSENLRQEKAFVQTLRAEYEAEKIKLINLRDELEQKKSALIRSKREMAESKQSLIKKSRELTFNKSKLGDITRKNKSLKLQLLTLDKEARIARQSSRNQATIAADTKP